MFEETVREILACAKIFVADKKTEEVKSANAADPRRPTFFCREEIVDREMFVADRMLLLAEICEADIN